MKNAKKKIFIFFVSVLISATYSVASADTVGLAVNQSVFSFDVDPGTEKEFFVNVENISNDKQQILLKPQDFIIGDNNQISSFSYNNELNGMKEWVKTENENIILEAKENRKIPIKVSVPKNATVGSHFSILGLNALPIVDGQNFQQTIVGGQIGVYVLVNVRGDVSGKGEIKDFEAPLITDKQAFLKADFENTGNIHYIPHGEIRIQNIFTRKVQNLETEKHFVFPGKKYSFQLNWNPPSLFGIYKAQALFVDGNSFPHVAQRFVFGKLSFISVIFLIVIIFVFFRVFKRNVKLHADSKN